MNPTIEQTSFAIPLALSAHNFAKKNYQGITKASQGKQIYLNSLAVYAVNRYLSYMGFKSDLETSDVTNLAINKFFNTADLEVKNIGKIECIPVLPGQDTLEIPEEIDDPILGLVAVSLNRELNEAIILGFSPNLSTNIPLKQLQSVEALLRYLTDLEQTQTVLVSDWLGGKIVEGWQQLEQLLSPQQQELAFGFKTRNSAFHFRKQGVSVRQARKVDLGMQLSQESVALVMEITPQDDNNQEVDILLQIHPIGKDSLPSQVELIVTDDSGNPPLKATSRDSDNWIQLAFGAESGESFRVTVALGEAQVKQDFVV